MAKIRVRYFVCRKIKSGKERFYWQPDDALRDAGWKMRRLPDDRAAAMQEAETINQALDNWRAGMMESPLNDAAGSINALISSYRTSRDFNKLADRTRKDYGYYLDRIAEWAGAEAATSITSRMVQDLYETQRPHSERKAAFMVQVLRLLFSYGERRSLVPRHSNPARNPRLEYRAGKGKIWTPEAVRHFVETADRMGVDHIGTAVMLNEWIGQRRGDLITLSMHAWRGGDLHIRQRKTGAEVVLPIELIPALRARLEAQLAANRAAAAKKKTAGTTLIQQGNGAPYTGDGFMSAFERIRAEAAKTMPEIADLVFKDLRHTAVTRLAEAGAEIPMIAAVTGHTFKSCQDIIDRYNVRTTRMAREAFSRRLQAENAQHNQH